MTPKTLLARDPSLLTESQWASIVNELAALGGWRRYHTYLSKRSPAGFPDLVLVKRAPRRIIFAELKRDAKESKTTPEQDAWLDDLREIARGVQIANRGMGATDHPLDIATVSFEVYVWRPSDWPAVVEVLTGRKPREEAA